MFYKYKDFFLNLFFFFRLADEKKVWSQKNSQKFCFHGAYSRKFELIKRSLYLSLPSIFLSNLKRFSCIQKKFSVP